MGSITSLFARKVVAQVGDEPTRDDLLRSIGLQPGAPADPAEMLSDADYYAFFERAARADADGLSLPLRTGASMRCDDYGAFGLAFKAAPTLGDSYRSTERYAQVLTSVSTYEIEDTDDGAFFHLRRDGERHLGMRLSNEASIASVLAISNEVATQPVVPLAVHFKHAAPASTAAHEAHFGCDVHFGSDRDALRISAANLKADNRLGDVGISGYLQSQLEAEVSRLDYEPPLERLVREEITRALSQGVPQLSTVARRLAMSPRSLQRRLADDGFTYQALIDESRRQLAETLLRETDFSLAEVAYMTGYSEQSALTRAFRRWAGQTPRSYRLEARPDR